MALVLAMFMVLIVSVLGASMLTVGRNETLSSLNYRSMSQARYGAESGLHSAVNYLLYTYAAPTVGGADPLSNYDTTVSPVTFNGNPVVLSSDPNVASNYPVAAVNTAFTTNSAGPLTAQNSTINYQARATLLSMRQFNDAFSGVPVTLQTWQITGVGGLVGAGNATVEVTSIIERQTVPAYRYAAFATHNGCSAITWGGNAGTGSYDSSAALVGGVPVVAASGGNVGTNGNLAEMGNAIVNGTLSTPRSGVGNCTANNVTALTVSGNASVTGGLVQLPQAVQMPNPAPINPLPPTTPMNLGSCPGGVPYCVAAGATTTFTPPSASTVVQLGDVTVNSNTTLRLNPGIYEVNSFSMTGNASLEIVNGGPVILRVAGTGVAAGADAFKIAGNGFSNPTYDPMMFQVIYGGEGAVRLVGNGAAAATVYAPNALASITGNGTLYGAVVAKTVTDMGNSRIAYDRRLERTALTSGNPTMTTFSWSSF
jgi:hypothetical protein